MSSDVAANKWRQAFLAKLSVRMPKRFAEPRLVISSYLHSNAIARYDNASRVPLVLQPEYKVQTFPAPAAGNALLSRISSCDTFDSFSSWGSMLAGSGGS